MAEIAREVGCTPRSVQFALDHHGIPRRRSVSQRFPEPLDGDEIRRRRRAGESTAVIAASYGLDTAVFGFLLARDGIRFDRSAVGADPRLRDGDWLRNAYLTDGRSTTSIAAELGCSVSGLRSTLGRFRITLRRRGPKPKIR